MGGDNLNLIHNNDEPVSDIENNDVGVDSLTTKQLSV